MRPSSLFKILEIEGNVGLRVWGGDGRGFENDIVQAEVVVGRKLSEQISMMIGDVQER